MSLQKATSNISIVETIDDRRLAQDLIDRLGPVANSDLVIATAFELCTNNSYRLNGGKEVASSIKALADNVYQKPMIKLSDIDSVNTNAQKLAMLIDIQLRVGYEAKYMNMAVWQFKYATAVHNILAWLEGLHKENQTRYIDDVVLYTKGVVTKEFGLAYPSIVAHIARQLQEGSRWYTSDKH